MKKLIITCAIVAFGLVSAQKNTLLVGGNISYNSQTDKNYSNLGDVKSDNFDFTPTVGYQFTDHFTAGIKLGVGSSKRDYVQNIYDPWGGYELNSNIKTNSFTYGVFGRYTLPLNETFSVFGDLDVLLNNSKSTVSYTTGFGNNSSDTKTTGFGVGFTPNLFINFKNSFGLNFNVGGISYQTEKVKDTEYKTNTFGFAFGKGISVGISKNFGLK